MEFLIVIVVLGGILYFSFKWLTSTTSASSQSPEPKAAVAKPPRPAQSGAAYVRRNLSHLPEQSTRLGGSDSSIYLPSDRWDELLVTDDDGLPTLHLQMNDGRLRLTEPTTGLFVSVGNRKLRRMGLWTVNLRGTDYYKAAVLSGAFHPGDRVQLKREPLNPYDKNAVAVCSAGTDAPAGHFNKGMASGFAKLIDAGAELEAIILRGPQRGQSGPIHVLAATPELVAHMLRKNPLQVEQ